MIFEKESLTFELLDVLALSQENVQIENGPRGFDALSFRLEADAEITAGGRAHPLHTGDVCFVPSLLSYTRRAQTDRMIVIHFHTLNYTCRQIAHFHPLDPVLYADLFQKALRIWQEKESGYRHRATAVVYEIFAEIYRENHREAPCPESIAPSVSYLFAHLLSPSLTIRDAAAQSYLSEVSFRKIFRQTYGLSPKKYVINARIKHAAALIESGYYALQEVAKLCGFTDYKYFSTAFRHTMGVCPSDYRYQFYI